MMTTLRYTLAQLKGQILGWGVGVAALGLLLVAFYDVFMEQQADFIQMLESYPPEFLAFFGGDAATMTTPGGYLGMYGFSMLPVIIGIYAIIVGSGLVASDEESGRLDLILAHPVGRRGLFFGRLLAFVVSTIAILLLGWLGFAIMLSTSSLDLTWGQMALPFLPVLAQALIYGTLALLFSLVLPARRLAAGAAGALMVMSYFISSMKAIIESLGNVAQFLPYDYFQGGDALDGLNAGWLLGLLAATLIFTAAAWRLFNQRDIRVTGEGNWGLPTLPFLRKTARETA
jgi:ABC-2 type transport system permease protein